MSFFLLFIHLDQFRAVLLTALRCEGQQKVMQESTFQGDFSFFYFGGDRGLNVNDCNCRAQGRTVFQPQPVEKRTPSSAPAMMPRFSLRGFNSSFGFYTETGG